MKKALWLSLLCMFGASATMAECDQVAGEWRVKNKIDMADCGEPDTERTINISISQSGCSVVLNVEGAVDLDGTVSGNIIKIDDSYEDEGTIYKELELKIDGDRMTGGGGWLWDSGDDDLSCGGMESFDGERAG